MWIDNDVHSRLDINPGSVGRLLVAGQNASRTLDLEGDKLNFAPASAPPMRSTTRRWCARRSVCSTARSSPTSVGSQLPARAVGPDLREHQRRQNARRTVHRRGDARARRHSRPGRVQHRPRDRASHSARQSNRRHAPCRGLQCARHGEPERPGRQQQPGRDDERGRTAGLQRAEFRVDHDGEGGTVHPTRDPVRLLTYSLKQFVNVSGD